MGFDRRPLAWQTVETVKIGAVKVVVTRVLGRQGPIYSVRLLRHDRGRDSNYIRAPDEGDDTIEALRRAFAWVERDRNGQG